MDDRLFVDFHSGSSFDSSIRNLSNKNYVHHLARSFCSFAQCFGEDSGFLEVEPMHQPLAMSLVGHLCDWARSESHWETSLGLD